jgi:uncharacterized protein (DUF1684 family)
MNELQQLRNQIDDFMGQHPQSPIPHDQRLDFHGLNYYAPNSDLIFQVAVDRFPYNEPLIEMETSTGDIRPYRRYGRFTFSVNGEEAQLTIYSDLHADDFFLPFRDATSGKETYGAGRYLDNHRPALQQLSDDIFIVDFNYAYSPYCAYQSIYSCPLPPHENLLNVPIVAGEKRWK